IVALASFGAWLLRHSATRYQHWLWVAALCLSLLVPVATAYQTLPAFSEARFKTTFPRELTNPVSISEIEGPFARTPASSSNEAFQLNNTLALVLFALFGAFIVYRSFRL